MIIRTMMVPAMSPPMIAAAIELNISSKSRGTIPSTVVREAIVTGLRRESDASISACWLCHNKMTNQFFVKSQESRGQ